MVSNLKLNTKINLIKSCPYCHSRDLSLKPAGIPYRLNSHKLDDLPEQAREYYGNLPTYKEAILMSNDLHLVCNKCNIGRRLTNPNLRIVFLGLPVQDRKALNKMLDKEIKTYFGG